MLLMKNYIKVLNFPEKHTHLDVTLSVTESMRQSIETLITVLMCRL